MSSSAGRWFLVFLLPLVVIGGPLRAENYQIISTYCVNNGGSIDCHQYPISGTGGAQGSDPSAWYPGGSLPRSGVFSGVVGNPQIDAKFRDALLSSLVEGQSGDTRAKLQDLQNAVRKYGSVGAATGGITQDLFHNLDEQITLLLAQPVSPAPLVPPSALPAGVSSTAVLKGLTPVIAAAKARDPFALTEAVAQLDARAAKGSPAYRPMWSRATDGFVTDRSGQLLGLPDAPALPGLSSSRFSPEGQALRHDLNRLRVGEQFIVGEYHRVCQSDAKACASLSDAFAGVQGVYTDALVAAALADRISAEGPSRLLDGLLGSLGRTADLLVAYSRGMLEASGNLAQTLITVAKNPMILADLGPRIMDAIVHLDETTKEIASIVAQNVDTLLFGTPEASAQLAGKLTFQIASSLVGGELVQGAMPALTEATTRALWSESVQQAAEGAVNLGKLSQAAGAGIGRLATQFPKAAREIWRTGLESEALAPLANAQAASGVSTFGDDLLTQSFQTDSTKTLALLHDAPWVTRTWPEVLETGRAVDDGTQILLEPSVAPISLPSDGIFARYVPSRFADSIEQGLQPLSGSPEGEAFVTAHEDLVGYPGGPEAAKRLGLFQDPEGTLPRDISGFKLLRFRFRSPDLMSLRCPIEIVGGRGFGFLPGGRTVGGAREWLIDGDANIKGLIEFIGDKP